MLLRMHARGVPAHPATATDIYRVSRGPAPLAEARLDVQGSKNGFNHLAALAMAGDGLAISLTGSPAISDRKSVRRMLRAVGVDATVEESTFHMAGRPQTGYVDFRAARLLRVSICYAAALAANVGWAMCPVPGGDAFTRRPVDLHLRVLEAAGAICTTERDGHRLVIHFRHRPRAFEVYLESRFGPSMGASVTALLVAAQATGVSTLRGLAPEPEVVAVTEALRGAGVRVERADCRVVRVHGAGGPLSGRLTIPVPPDRMEAATYVLVGATMAVPTHVAGIGLASFPAGLLSTFAAMGIAVREGSAPGGVPVTVATAGRLSAASFRTGPHPEFPTDVQPQVAAALTQADGLSLIGEDIYAERLTHVPELAALGLHIEVRGTDQVIRGPQRPTGGVATVRDIRCGAAILVAAAASAEPVTVHDPAGHLRRGYSELRHKLAAFGVDVDVDVDESSHEDGGG